MTFDSNFSSIAKILLQGGMICEVSHEHYYQYLQDEHNAQCMHDYLYKIGRTLSSTEDKAVFFAAFLDPNTLETRSAIRSQFRKIATNLEALVRWMRLAMASNPSGKPITAGDIINESELIACIENSPGNLKALEELARTPYINSKSSNGTAMIKQVTKTLCEDGYLVPIGPSGSRFRATGKWSWLYKVMDFIRDYEGLSDEENVKQMELV